MKQALFIIAFISGLFLVSCNSELTLQKYFVENSEKKDFIALDISSDILNVDKTKLTAVQKEALQSFDKINVLAFKLDDKNKAQFETERAKVKSILKNTIYQPLMRIGSGKEGASVSYVETDGKIDEFVLFANKNDAGFAIVRVLGKDMNPTNIMNMVSVLKESKVNLDQLKPLQELIKKK
ncbi:DUF4252 domain-containing protein [Flavobacterium gilvum]|uniref:DUF4252 domain-containing protein n=1 Tax=Flavobacterium gilvum TaxID=1492737 RepID=A0AAC9N7U0_9FLAO|nr:DUF4252 domain-containing protein [Flavobacterium gilvum]AOW11098.1 hypothetical protein EM308_17315 [Flavobacterium gilvum]KFC61022.1 hypothetical protein FEM08_01440 [Flavobacterium gilvum]